MLLGQLLMLYSERCGPAICILIVHDCFLNIIIGANKWWWNDDDYL